jgi:DNA-binding MarR family transcriptional regulator
MTESLRRCDHSIEGAAAVLRGLRAATLNYGSISLTQSFVLDKGTGMTRDQLIHQLVEVGVDILRQRGETVDAAEVTGAINQLEERGLITTGPDGTIENTNEGTARIQQVHRIRDDVLSRLYAGVTPDQLATTVSVLDLLAQQAEPAHALIPRAAAGSTE